MSDRGYFHRLNTMSPVSVVLLHERHGGVMLFLRLQPVAKDSVVYASNSESSAGRRGASPFEKARRQVFAGTCKTWREDRLSQRLPGPRTHH